MFTPEYEDLIKRVEAIDPAAAEYLRTEAPKLNDFDPDPNLITCFYWDGTPQGLEYWDNLSIQLGEWE